MDLFSLSASISIAIQDAVESLQRVGEEATRTASTMENSVGGNNEVNVDTNEAISELKKLKKEIESQEKELSDLEEEYTNIVLTQGNASEEAIQLANKIQTLNGKLQNNKQALSNAEAETKNLTKGLGDAQQGMSDTEEKSGSLATKLGVVGKVIAGVGVAVVGLVGGFLGLAESSREYREDVGKLEVAFKNAGHSTELATDTYKELYSILGESDRSVEAANHLAELTQSERELAMWSDITAGVVGRFGDSLPLESLTESANETAKVGQVTGALADAINWAGGSEEEFNQALAQCNSEQERATLITEMLNDLYQEAGQTYKDVNGDIIDANKAQSNLTDTIAKFGAIAEPILTTLKILANDLLTTMLPMVDLIGQGLTGLLNGTEGASQQLADGISGIINQILNMAMTLLPTLVDLLGDILGNLITSILDQAPRLLEVIMEVIIQLVNLIGELVPMIVIKLSELLPDLIIAIVNSIPALLTALIQVIDAIVQALPIVIENLLSAIPILIEVIVDVLLNSIDLIVEGAITLFNSILEALPVIIEALKRELPNIINTIVNKLIEALPIILDAAITLLNAIIEALPTIINLLVIELPKIIFTIQKTLLENYPAIINAAIQLFTGIIKAIPQILGGLGKAMGDIKDEIFDALGEIDLFEIGKDILQGLIDGMASIGSNVWGAITDIGESVVSGFKDFFDIHSPSQLIKKEVGANVGEAIGVGAVESIPNIKKDINILSNSVYDELSNLGASNETLYNTSGSLDDTNFIKLLDRLDNLENTFKGLKIYLDNGVLVGELMPTIDNELGNIAIARERGR